MNGLRRLRAFVDSSRPRTAEGCELCGGALGEVHRHVAEIDQRVLQCACPPCHLLFAADGAGGGRYRSVPDRWARSDVRAAQWDSLDVPVGTAFVVSRAADGTATAFYPGPAGATESALPGAWRDVIGDTVEPDVEALLVRRTAAGCESYVVPVDACYELVGVLRHEWSGFSGGDAASAALDAFFDRVRERAR